MVLDEEDVREQMTKEVREDFLKSGCDPACHICGELLGVGDWYGMQTFVAADEMFTLSGGVMRVNISGTACIRCIDEKRDWPEEERKKMLERLGRVMPPPMKPPEPETPKPKREPGRGCYVLDDGTRF